jgi:hypothetical protein
MADTAKTVENLDRQRLDALAKGDYAKADRLSREADRVARGR